jgi:hypothetical protein
MERFVRNIILEMPSLRGGNAKPVLAKAGEAIQNGDCGLWIAALPVVARDDDEEVINV